MHTNMIPAARPARALYIYSQLAQTLSRIEHFDALYDIDGDRYIISRRLIHRRRVAVYHRLSHDVVSRQMMPAMAGRATSWLVAPREHAGRRPFLYRSPRA